ncbi:hypothetical protein Rhopal_006876-T1 [Rhodotorula paludigena]|uniref:Uncharacterized protein n=1 Tax=Rhodotorula paludigena TaxID=86838 RepID=A0AAV5GZ90_9BASI|nr:hypothetical protein Rhopal_006876-T1 [Rhodotorula paludigena]
MSPTSGPPVPTAPASALEYHIYKDSRLFGKDDIITGVDKQQQLYHLHFPHTFFGSWDLALHRGGPAGPHVCQINKGGWGDSFVVSFSGGPQVQCIRTGFFSNKYEFAGANNTVWYCWKPDSRLFKLHSFSLYRTEDLKLPRSEREGKALAHFRYTMSFSKDGQLSISPNGIGSVEIVEEPSDVCRYLRATIQSSSEVLASRAVVFLFCQFLYSAS